jgi:glycosyltransferase involved in cell wall biosynthesis
MARERRHEIRAGLGLGEGDVAVLGAGRLAPEKGFDTVVRAVGSAGAPLVLLLGGEGALRHELERLAQRAHARLTLLGDLSPERLLEAYVAADVFALLSHHEPWGVVVNEAAATGLPLVLSDRVGAAYDLLRDGENGFLVAAGDVRAAADALHRLADDPELRRTMGARSRELVSAWGYEPSVESFVAAALEATAR